MKRLNVEALRDDELVSRFAAAAKERGAAVLDSEARRANRMFHYMRAIDAVLRARGLEARQKLLPLLEDEDRFVRYYAAMYLVALNPKRARAIIEGNARNWFDALAGDAGMALDALDNGIFKSD